MIGVPKGLLRHITMQILKRRPMSGSELMDEIENYTDWRPSPGSIYPLLASMQDEELIKPYSDEDPSLKRVSLTSKGLKELDEIMEHSEQFRSRNKSIRKIYWLLIREMPEDIYLSFSNMMDTVEQVYSSINGNDSKSAELKKILDRVTQKISRLGD
jgi:DNA-binding PadR family transcriptional regulator